MATKKPNHPPDSMAIDTSGRPLPYSPSEAKAIALDILDKGTLRAVVSELPDGTVGVNVFGPPSIAVCDSLQQAADALRTALKGS